MSMKTGKTSFEFKGQKIELEFGFDALANLEAEMGPMMLWESFEAMQHGKISFLLLRAGLVVGSKWNPKLVMSKEKASALIQEGSFKDILMAVTEGLGTVMSGINLSSKDGDEEAPKGDPSGPETA